MSKHSWATAGFAVIALYGLAYAWIGPAQAGPEKPSAQIESTARPTLASGDLVRLRSGGPLMTVETVEGDRVICHWSTEFGEPRSGSFHIADLSAPIASPRPDQNEKSDEAVVDRYYRKHCPSGSLTFAGRFVCAL
jgi:uncharacterized protein YodC (DUF2158 family)